MVNSTDNEVEILWYLTGPDGRYPWRTDGQREINYPYFQQLARGVDHLGYSGALLATGIHDTWVLGSSLIPLTDRFQFLVAIHPQTISPTLLAKMASTFDNFSEGRLKLNIVNGADKLLAQHGAHLNHDERYAYTGEYLEILTRLFNGETVDYRGQHLQVDGAQLDLPTRQIGGPEIYVSGSSEAAHEVAAQHSETYLSWGETPQVLAEKFTDVRRRAQEAGRPVPRLGVRLYVVVRETEEEAWAAAGKLFDQMDEESVARTQKLVATTDSVGQRRMVAQHGAGKPSQLRDLEVYPNIWSGIGLVRPGPGSALVGNPEQVKDRLDEYREAGAEVFILSGMPLLEEAYRFGELVLPHLNVSRTSRKTLREPDRGSVAWADWSATKDQLQR